MPLRLAYLLIDGFALMSYAPVIEPFRAANRLTGEPRYSWRHYSQTGAPALASNGVKLSVDSDITTMAAADILFVCAGGNPALFTDTRTFDALRRAARFGTCLAGVSGGPFLLARAGLLDGYACTIHWEHQQAFAETFPAPQLQSGLFVIDRDRITCAGGLAGLDLATALITEHHGAALAREVADWYIQPERRSSAGLQRSSAAKRYRVRHKGLEAVMDAMEANIAVPLDRSTLSCYAGVSIRQLERLFAAQLGNSILAQYISIRLERARSLLIQTNLSITEISMMTGFCGQSHFARSFRELYGMSPTTARRSSAV